MYTDVSEVIYVPQSPSEQIQFHFYAGAFDQHESSNPTGIRAHNSTIKNIAFPSSSEAVFLHYFCYYPNLGGRALCIVCNQIVNTW